MGRVLFVLSVLTGAVVTVLAWFLLPDPVPMHFGGAGKVDRWGSRAEYVATTGALIGGLALLFWILTLAVPRMSGTMLNIPSRDRQWWLATAERRAELNRRLVNDLNVMGAATIAFIVVIHVFVVVQSQRTQPSLGPLFWAALAVYLIGALGYTGWLIAVRYRTPRNGGTF